MSIIDLSALRWRRRLRRSLTGLGLAFLASLALVAGAADLAELRGRLEKDFQLLPVQNGLVLTPREPFRGIRSIEIAGDQIAVNGQTVTRGEVEDWLGERAAAVLAVGDLDRDSQARLAGRSASPSMVEAPASEVPAPVAPPAPPEAPEPSGAQAEPSLAAEPSSATGSEAAPAKGSVHVRSGETVEQVFVVGGSATIDGKVERDATVFGGNLRVNGKVQKDVVAFGGNVYLGPESRVGGDVTSVAGQVERAEGSEVGGRIQEVKGGWSFPLGSRNDSDDDDDSDERHGGWSPVRGLVGFGVSLAALVAFALLILLVVAAAPRSVERVGERIAGDPVRSALIGLLVLILIFPLLVMVTVLLAVTIIGIPIVVFLWLTVGPALAVAFLLGYASVAVRVGRFLERRFSWQLGPSAYAAALVGVLALSALSLVGDFASALGGILFFGFLFSFLGALVAFSALLVGFGGVCQVFLAGRTVFRWRVPGGRPEVPPVPPSPAG